MDRQIVLIIISMAVVTFLPRALPLVMFNKVEFPPLLIKWLGFIPAAVLAALLAPDLFLPEGYWELSLSNIHLLAALPTLIIALVTKSMIWALLGGMGSFAILQFLA